MSEYNTPRAVRVLKIAFTLALVYLACWFASYCLVMGHDFRYVSSYFRLGWSGGLEIPAGIQLLALSATAVIGVTWWGVNMWKRGARRSNPA